MERRPESSSSFEMFSLLWSQLERDKDTMAADGHAYIQPQLTCSNEDWWLFTWNISTLGLFLLSYMLRIIGSLNIHTMRHILYCVEFPQRQWGASRSSRITPDQTAESVTHPQCALCLCHSLKSSAEMNACWTGWLQRPSWVCCFQKWRHEEKQTVCNPAGLPVAASAQPFGPNHAPSHARETDIHVQLYYYMSISFIKWTPKKKKDSFYPI